jgi:hypothetical protein
MNQLSSYFGWESIRVHETPFQLRGPGGPYFPRQSFIIPHDNIGSETVAESVHYPKLRFINRSIGEFRKGVEKCAQSASM